MATIGNILLDKEILLESGTNELELLVFTVADFTFGINVAKVREVLNWQQITSLPKAHPSICGVFKLRNRVIPCVSLSRHLGIRTEGEESQKTIILTDFNQQQTAFVVDSVDRIYRLSWKNILAMPGLDSLAQTPVTALARHENQLVVMLDFEMILDSVTSQFFRCNTIDNPTGLPREKYRILFAEDSPTVREAIGRTLRKSGYRQIRFFDNGAEAWRWIESEFSKSGSVQDVGDIVISDVEMPQIDGFHLTKRIKQHPQLSQLPVLLYSSIVTPDNHKKGKMVGADAQVSKPELSKVVELVDELLGGGQQAFEPSESETLANSQEDSQCSQHADESAGESQQQPQPCDCDSEGIETCRLQDVVETLVQTPSGVEHSLWTAFRHELHDHVAHLEKLLECAESEDNDDELTRDILRTLHTIKSAAMVVPVDPVTRCAHLAEDLVAAAGDNPQLWKNTGLGEFTAWLDRLANASIEIDSLLDNTEELETLLSIHVL